MQILSQKIISRVLRYSRVLDAALTRGQEYISSAEISARTGFSDAQVRKDISLFGKVGRPRLGYKIEALRQVFEDFVLQNTVHVVLFGVGHLGQAILRYPGFDKEKIQIVAAFDRDPGKIGQTINGVRVFELSEARRVVQARHAEIGINAVPVTASQEVADVMVAAGLKGIINFAPTTLAVRHGVHVRNIDFTIEFLSLFCDIQNGSKE